MKSNIILDAILVTFLLITLSACSVGTRNGEISIWDDVAFPISSYSCGVEDINCGELDKIQYELWLKWKGTGNTCTEFGYEFYNQVEGLGYAPEYIRFMPYNSPRDHLMIRIGEHFYDNCYLNTICIAIHIADIDRFGTWKAASLREVLDMIRTMRSE